MVVMEVMRVVENGDHEPPSVLQMGRSTQAAEGRPMASNCEVSVTYMRVRTACAIDSPARTRASTRR